MAPCPLTVHSRPFGKTPGAFVGGHPDWATRRWPLPDFPTGWSTRSLSPAGAGSDAVSLLASEQDGRVSSRCLAKPATARSWPAPWDQWACASRKRPRAHHSRVHRSHSVHAPPKRWEVRGSHPIGRAGDRSQGQPLLAYRAPLPSLAGQRPPEPLGPWLRLTDSALGKYVRRRRHHALVRQPNACRK